MIRPLTADDLEQVVQLFVIRFHKGEGHDPARMVAYFRRLYLENPWVDDTMPSLVVEDGGRVAGFMGVVPMPVRIDGVPLTVAVGGNFMVDERLGDPMAASRLLRAFFAGGQALAFTDTANADALRMWLSLGGSVARFSSARWLLPLRAGALGAEGMRRSGAGRKVAWVAKPFVRPADRLARGQLDHGAPTLVARPVEPSELRALLAAVGTKGYAQLDVDDRGFAWLVEMCREKRQYGPLRAVLFADADRDVGGVLYYPNRDGLGQVVLLVARDGFHDAVVSSLADDARRQGSAALMGQADPRLLVPLGRRPCGYVQRDEFVTVRPASTDAARAAAARIVAGDLSMSRLLGEWWTRMQGDTF